ncbi:MAG: family 43 glycosylhydrolase [Bacteroidales bacterium]|nr:family 43 glycosylhydrolase [Bacteroidales bacterium]MBN2763758.1 family 43 glycosylhydrolase [Bacteroidales bacterium]
MKQLIIILVFTCCLTGCRINLVSMYENPETYCNPVNISYRFCLDEPSRREAADPTVISFKEQYFLFASKSGGYWYSGDLEQWTFIESDEIPVEEYAPTVIAISDTLYFLASSGEKSTVYKTADPLSGKWSVAREELEMPVWDPAFFLDDDNRLYLYWGCSNVNPIYGIELDYGNNFAFIGKPKELIKANPDLYGWEVPGDYNTLTGQSPWIEGAWVNKHKGRYYLQYAGPGTEFKSYSDGVYVAEDPLGPYSLQPHNPFSYKPGGFAAGAGHGSTFHDNFGNYWHIGTITISVKHMFERRLGLYPTFFDHEGMLYTLTKYGDYPLIIPRKKVTDFNELFLGWMLLSYNKKVEVSSSIDSLPASNMTDENIRTYWAAESGDSAEYATIDLGESYNVYSVQVNFAEHNTEIFGRQKDIYHRYTINQSDDGINWTLLADKSQNKADNTHDYIRLPEKVSCRYLRINNLEVPGGNFAISGFRVFGKGDGKMPGKISEFEAIRNDENRKSVKLIWNKPDNATGYNISYGIDKNKLYQNCMVYRDTVLIINSLNAGQPYCFAIESFNENGITQGGILRCVE